jgi:hypothetical protein
MKILFTGGLNVHYGQVYVEVSFEPTADDVALVQWGGEAAWPLAVEPVDLRARYCAWGMDHAWQADTILSGGPQLDRYLLQFWPAPPAPDRVLKQTSVTAAYWHTYASTGPHSGTGACR